MPDDELIRFTKNESQQLTLESFHLLKSELESRNLDLSFIEAAEVDKQLAEAVKISEFEKATANEFLETIWQFAFDAKERGNSDKVIFESLSKKNINPEYAYMLIASIEPKARELVDSFDTEIIVGWIFAILGAVLVIYTLGADSATVSFLLWGAIMVIGGIGRLAISYSKKKKFQTIVKNIMAEREDEDQLYQ